MRPKAIQAIERCDRLRILDFPQHSVDEIIGRIAAEGQIPNLRPAIYSIQIIKSLFFNAVAFFRAIYSHLIYIATSEQMGQMIMSTTPPNSNYPDAYFHR